MAENDPSWTPGQVVSVEFGSSEDAPEDAAPAAPSDAPFTLDNLKSLEKNAPPGLSKEALPIPEWSGDPTKTPFTLENLRGLGLESDSNPSATDYTIASGIGASKGAVEGAGAYAGIKAGLKIGEALAPTLSKLPPKVAPYAVGAGYVGGVGASLLGGATLADALMQYLPEPPKGTKAHEAWFETFVSGLVASPSAKLFPEAQAGSGTLSRAISAIGVYARANPKPFFKKEVLSNAYAALGGSLAVDADPNSPWLRTGMEITFGTLSPGKFAFDANSAVSNLRNQANTAISSGTASRNVANYYASLLEDTGLDVETLIKKLNAPDALDVNGKPIKLTAAQKLGISPFTSLERTLVNNSVDFANQSNKMATDALVAYKTLISRLQSSGDPAAMTAAAKLRDAHYTDLLTSAINGAEVRAANAVATLGKSGSASREEIGSILRKSVDSALSNAREMESSLWGAGVRAEGFKKTATGKIIPVKLAPQNTKEAFLEIAHDLTPEDLNGNFSAVNSALKRFGVSADSLKIYRQGMQTQEFIDTGRIPAEFLAKIKIKQVPAYDLIAFRSSLLDAARKADAAGEAGAAQKYSHLASSVLDDLSTLPGTAYANARAFSFKLNEEFTRKFGGELNATNKRGGARYQPEILVNKAFARAGDVAALRMGEIEDAVKFMGNQYDDAVAKFGIDSPQAEALFKYKDLSTQQFNSVRDAQSRVIKLAVADMADPNTGLIKPDRLARYVAKNADLIERLGLTNELSNVAAAQHTYLSVKDTQSALNKSLREEEAFSNLLRFTDDPTRALTDALNSDNPVSAMRSMVKIAKQADPKVRADAEKGLVSMVFQHAFEQASKNGNFDVQAYEDALFKPIRSGQPSVVNIMRANGLMSLTQLKNMKRLLDPMSRISEAAKAGRLENTMPGGVVNEVESLAINQLGLKLAAATKPGGPGSLAWAAKVSRATSNFFSKTPARQAMKMLEEAALDDEVTAAFLAKGKTEGDRKALNLSLLRRMYSPGVTSTAAFRQLMAEDDRALEEFDAKERAQARAAEVPARQQLRRMPPAPSTRGTSSSRAPAAPAPAAPAPGPVSMATPQGPEGEQSASRKMLQSLFPMDTISSMA
jgi:hypothetical protein